MEGWLLSQFKRLWQTISRENYENNVVVFFWQSRSIFKPNFAPRVVEIQAAPPFSLQLCYVTSAPCGVSLQWCLQISGCSVFRQLEREKCSSAAEWESGHEGEKRSGGEKYEVGTTVWRRRVIIQGKLDPAATFLFLVDKGILTHAIIFPSHFLHLFCFYISFSSLSSPSLSPSLPLSCDDEESVGSSASPGRQGRAADT